MFTYLKNNFQPFLCHVFFLTIIFIIVLLPLWRQIAVTPAGTFFSKLHRIHEDYYYNLSIIHQGRRQLVEINQYTTEEAKSSRIHLYYLLLGRIGSKFGISDISMYYYSMFSSLLLFYLFSYGLLTLFIKRRIWLYLFIILFASPFPPLELKLGNYLFNLKSPWWTGMDVYSRLTLLPHHYISLALMLAATYFLIRFYYEQKLFFSFLCALSLGAGILFFAVPQMFLLISLLLTLLTLKLKDFFIYTHLTPVRQLAEQRLEGYMLEQTRVVSVYREIRITKSAKTYFGWFLIIFISVSAFAYIQYEISSLGFPWSHFLKFEYNTYQAEIYPYQFYTLLVSYGLLFIFFLFSLPSVLRKANFSTLFTLFMVLTPLLLYFLSWKGVFHIPKTRLVYNAPYVFMGLLTSLWFEKLIKKSGNEKIKSAMVAVIFIFFLINALLGLRSYWLLEVNKKSLFSNIYIPLSYFSAMDYLNKNTSAYSAVLSTYYTGVYLPSFTYNKVYLGNEVGTYDFTRKWWEVEQFFSGKFSETEVKELIVKGKIDYILWDAGELPEKYKNLTTPVYNIEHIAIYKVKDFQ